MHHSFALTPDRAATIRALSLTDLPAVVEIHRLQFPAARSTELGGRFLRAMYRWFIQNYPNLAVGASIESELVGFAVGAVGGYGRRITRAAALEIGLALASRPWLLLRRSTFRQWRSLAIGFTTRHQSTPASALSFTKASLASIAVVESYKGTGIGGALLLAFEEGARSYGVERLGLSVGTDNHRARRLYERCGWTTIAASPESASTYYWKVIGRTAHN